MGFWDFLVGQSVRIHDEGFGSLLFFAAENHQGGYFEGERLFRPTGTRVELAIDGALPGPTVAQRAFYHQVESWCPELLPALQTMLTAEVRRWLPAFEIQDFTREFWPVHLSGPLVAATELNEVEWEVAFEAVSDKNHTFTVSLRGPTPYAVLVDG